MLTLFIIVSVVPIIIHSHPLYIEGVGIMNELHYGKLTRNDRK